MLPRSITERKLFYKRLIRNFASLSKQESVIFRGYFPDVSYSIACKEAVTIQKHANVRVAPHVPTRCRSSFRRRANGLKVSLEDLLCLSKIDCEQMITNRLNSKNVTINVIPSIPEESSYVLTNGNYGNWIRSYRNLYACSGSSLQYIKTYPVACFKNLKLNLTKLQKYSTCIMRNSDVRKVLKNIMDKSIIKTLRSDDWKFIKKVPPGNCLLLQTQQTQQTCQDYCFIRAKKGRVLVLY